MNVGCFQAQKSSEVKEGKTSCQPKTFSPEEYLSYVFYFPLFFTGPIYTYHRFYEEVWIVCLCRIT